MKTRILILFLSFGISAAVCAQSAREQKLLDKMCREACDEINKTDFNQDDSKDEIETKLGLALLPVFNANSEEIKKVWGLDINNPDDSRTLGEKIGAPLVYKCDKFKNIIAAMPDDEEESGDTEAGDGSAGTASEGWIERIDCGQVCLVYFRTTGDETIPLYWLDKVSGSSILESFTGAQKDRKFSVRYREQGMYQPKTKSYETVKVITAIEQL